MSNLSQPRLAFLRRNIRVFLTTEHRTRVARSKIYLY